MRSVAVFVSAALVAILIPAIARAQAVTTGNIAGVVRDTTSGVMPGVTVEASSPALIEKVRSAVTDQGGQYKIVDLRPGTYTVTFSLPGFATIQREGLELTTGVTATVDAEMRVSAVQETLTVTASAPVVDAQNTRTQTVLTRTVLDDLPSGKTVQAYGALTLGAVATPDVGGNKGEAPVGIGIHGSAAGEMRQQIDGMNINIAYSTGGGGLRFFMVDSQLGDEVTLQTGGSAEAETGGIQLNLVPKSGANRFKSSFWTGYTDGGLQANNLDDALRTRGLTSGPSVSRIYDYGGDLGGPITPDRLWFYTGHRWWGSREFQPGSFFNATPNALFYTPDLSRQGYTDLYNEDHAIRFTWQALEKAKINAFYSLQNDCNCFNGVSSTRAPEATALARFWPMSVTQVTFDYPASNRLLFEAGYSYGSFARVSTRPPQQSFNTISVTDITSGFIWGSQAGNLTNDYGLNDGTQANGRASVSYITGSHAFKMGMNFEWGRSILNFNLNEPPETYSFRNCFTTGCQPVSITEIAAPSYAKALVHTYGLYAQDQWTAGKLTLNLGVRFDYLHEWIPAQTRPAGTFVQAFNFAEIDNVPLWKDINPRLGLAYDLFGNGKTAVKAFIGRYVASEGTSVAQANNPSNSIVTTASRTWSDSNGDFVPQANELGPISNAAFGTVQINTHYAADVLTGWGVRPSSWEGSATLQHELLPGLGMTVAYFRLWMENFMVTQNRDQPISAFDPYCVAAPTDPRLAGGGGGQICGLYDLRPAYFGVASAGNVVTQASNFGKQSSIYNGIDASVNARLGKGRLVTGGVSTGQTTTDNCQIITDTPQKQFCHQVNPWTGQTQYKASGVYPLPWDLQASAVYQNLPGVPDTGTLSYSNAQIASSLGRNLSGCPAVGTCTATRSIVVLQPFMGFEKRQQQVDARLTRMFRIGRANLKGMVDLYNVFNANTILSVNGTYGSAWLRPTAVLGGRLVKFGGQLQF